MKERSPLILPQRAATVVAVDDDALQLIAMALAEDRGPGDWTTRWTVPARTRAEAEIVAKAEGVIAGLGLAAAVFLRLDPRVEMDVEVTDGGVVHPGDIVCHVRGPARALLTGERVALNFLQRLSGIATLTRRYVAALAGTGTKVLDTRKTTPGWRTIEKGAVRAGGGENHRAGLFDMIMIKDNHKAIAGGIAAAVARIRDQNTRELPVCVEIHSLDEMEDALAAGVDRLLLDNMDLATLAAAVRKAQRSRPRPELEASGNMTLERVRQVAETGVDFISVGALTHSAAALDLSMRFRT